MAINNLGELFSILYGKRLKHELKGYDGPFVEFTTNSNGEFVEDVYAAFKKDFDKAFPDFPPRHNKLGRKKPYRSK